LRLAPAQAAAVDTQLEQDFESPDNFYGILGIPQNASQRDIKRAYKAMMKDFHPDLSGDEESTEFCILLNEIYEVCWVLRQTGVVGVLQPVRSQQRTACTVRLPVGTSTVLATALQPP
jgi:hypothetical protein